MLYMNRHEVSEARERYVTHPILGPATTTLAGLVEAVDHCSDSWAYWPAPVRAARRLMALIGTTREYLDDRDRSDVTEPQLRRAYAPLKSFRTRRNVPFVIHPVEDCQPELGEVLHATR